MIMEAIVIIVMIWWHHNAIKLGNISRSGLVEKKRNKQQNQ